MYQFLLLNYNQLIQLVKSEAISTELGIIQASDVHLNEDLRNLISDFYIPNLADSSQDPVFYSLYVVYHTAQKTIIGDIGFKGAPNLINELEIGYSVYPKFRNKQHMTHILSEFCQLNHRLLKQYTLIAYTEKENIASQKVLLNNAFSLCNEDDEFLKFSKPAI